MPVVDLDGNGNLDVVVTGTATLAVLLQADRTTDPGNTGWFLDASPDPHAAGVGVRPTIDLDLGRTLGGGAVNVQMVRLIDGLPAVDVVAVGGYDAGSGTLTVTPTADLVPGRHYAVLLAD